MSEMGRFSALVASIHDASLDQSLWSHVLEQICVFVPGPISSIFLHDAVAKRAHVGFDRGVEAAWRERYLTQYAKIDPMFPALLFCEAGEIFCSSDLTAAAQMAQTRFCREFLAPQGFGEAVGAVLDKSATSFAAFTVILAGSPGRVEQDSVERLRLLVPHVQRAVLTGRAIDGPKVAAERQRAALSPSTFPELVARQFGLTPKELGVMLAIVDVGDVTEVASILGLSPAAIRTHLMSILAKTGAKDQADLVKLFAKLANPAAR